MKKLLDLLQKFVTGFNFLGSADSEKKAQLTYIIDKWAEFDQDYFETLKAVIEGSKGMQKTLEDNSIELPIS